MHNSVGTCHVYKRAQCTYPQLTTDTNWQIQFSKYQPLRRKKQKLQHQTIKLILRFKFFVCVDIWDIIWRVLRDGKKTCQSFCSDLVVNDLFMSFWVWFTTVKQALRSIWCARSGDRKISLNIPSISDFYCCMSTRFLASNFLFFLHRWLCFLLSVLSTNDYFISI